VVVPRDLDVERPLQIPRRAPALEELSVPTVFSVRLPKPQCERISVWKPPPLLGMVHAHNAHTRTRACVHTHTWKTCVDANGTKVHSPAWGWQRTRQLIVAGIEKRGLFSLSLCTTILQE
jgi:hypothetical protein